MGKHSGALALLSPGHLKAMAVRNVGKRGIEASVSGLTEMSILGLVAGAGFGILSTVTNQIEYMHERKSLASFYRDQLAAQHHKAASNVTERDLDAVEKSDAGKGISVNGVIKEAVDQERKYRNLGIGVSFATSIAVFALMTALPLSAPVLFSVAGMAKVAVGVLSYIAIKQPLMALGEQIFGLDKDTTHDKIMEITKDRAQGKVITREQVVEVFISANKEMSSYVKEHFGREYEQLALADKVKVAAEIASLIPVDKITQNINLGTATAAELAFTAEGQISGALPKAPEVAQAHSTSKFQQFSRKISSMMHSVRGMFAAEKAQAIPVVHPAPAAVAPVAMQEEGQGGGFVERLGRAPVQQQSYAQQVTDRRAQQVALAGSPSLH